MSNPTDEKSATTSNVPSLPELELTEEQKAEALAKIRNMSMKEKLNLIDSIYTIVESNHKADPESYNYKVGFKALQSALALSFDVIDELSLSLEKERKALDQLSLSVILKKALSPT